MTHGTPTTATTSQSRSSMWARSLRERFAQEPQLLLPLFAANAVGYLPLLTLPWLISVLVRDRGYSDSSAGMVATAELALLAGAAIILGSQVNRLPLRALAVAGGCCAFGTVAALGLSLPSAVLIALLALTGLGCGATSAAGTSLLSLSRDPGRLTANLWVWTVIWQALMWFVTPLLVARWHAYGLCLVFAVTLAVLLPMLRRMPVSIAAEHQTLATTRSASILDTRLLIALLFCAFAFWLRDALNWSLAERRGALLGLSEYQLAATLAAASIVGLAGPLSANYLGLRLGRAKTLAGALLLIALITQLIAGASSPVAYCAGFVLWTAGSVFAWTYVMECAATADPNGRIVAMCGGMMFAASACGPLLGGALLERGGLGALPIAVVLLSIITLIAGLFSAARLARRAPE